jgi:AbiV family abortive infection protein
MNTKNINLKKLEKMAGLAFKNGLRLHYDSILLFKNKSYATAFSLSIFAAEEIAKAFLIEHQWWHSLINGKRTPQEEENWLQLIYNHKVKQSNFVYFLDGPLPESKLLKKFYNGSIEMLKQNSIYVGLKKQGKKIILNSKVNNPLIMTREKAHKMITLLNDKLLELCLLQIKNAGGPDAESIRRQLNRHFFNKLKTKWPVNSHKTKQRLIKIESV